MPELEGRGKSQSGALLLLARTNSRTALIEAQSRAPIVDQGLNRPDLAVVALS